MKVPSNCVNEFPMIRKGINSGIFSIESEGLTMYSVEKRDKNQNWCDFVSTLPNDKCCHVFTHFPYTAQSDNVEREKFTHILWAPSKASRKDKMQLSFFAQNILTEFGASGITRIEAGDVGDLDYDIVKEKIVRKLTVK